MLPMLAQEDYVLNETRRRHQAFDVRAERLARASVLPEIPTRPGRVVRLRMWLVEILTVEPVPTMSPGRTIGTPPLPRATEAVTGTVH